MSNCQILQTRVNRTKSDKENLEKQHMEHFSCNIRVSDAEMDLVEMAVYGNVIRPGMQCRVRSVAEGLGLVAPPTPEFPRACELPYQKKEASPHTH